MFDRYEAGEQAVLVHIEFPNEGEREDLHELEMLVASAGAQSLDIVTGRRQSPHSKYFCGTGKAEEIAEAVKLHNANVIIFNHALSPSQEKHLEELCQCRVVDRTNLILDIFAQRARTHEGKLQVELAQLRHLTTRLIRGWTHLERQKGGIGLRGPGETQLETDRRLIRGRISHLLKRLEKVSKQRQQGRKARQKAEIATVSLVGYTNAGKSTLFNKLTDSEVYAADQLFATLDPTLRKIPLQDIGQIILADTVGFIRHLPHDLVAAFKSTLAETREADLLIHVVDVADERRQDNIIQVNDVLAEIEADDVPVLLVYNKIDKLEKCQARIERDDDGLPYAVWLSAQQGEGLDLFRQAVAERLGESMVERQLSIPPSMSQWRGRLFEMNCIAHEQYNDDGNWVVDVKMPSSDWQRLQKKYPQDIEAFIVN